MSVPDRIPELQSAPHERTPRKSTAGVFFGGVLLTASLVLARTTVESAEPQRSEPLQELSPSEHVAQSVTPNTTARISQDNGGATTLTEFQRAESVSQQTVTKSFNTALKLQSDSGTCTGAIINTYLVTAAHCEPRKSALTARYFRPGESPDDFGVVSATKKWIAGTPTGTDLLVAQIDEKTMPSINLPHLAVDNPQPGTRFIASSLPSEEQTPVVSSLTFLYEQPATIVGPEAIHSGRKWVFALGPDNDKKAQSTACDRGASGTLVQSDGGYVGVITDSIDGTEFSPEAWQAARTPYETISGVDLSSASAICLATPVDAATFTDFTNRLRQK